MREEVERYYGEVLQSSADLKTDACCTETAPPDHLRAILAGIHEAVSSRYYGCGLVLPEALEGLSVLDLGCGAGRDCYVLAALTGTRGRVVGIDMTPAQLEIARAHREYHANRFGYPASNVEFVMGDIERLDEAGLGEGRFDLIVSNCVINLAADKSAVLGQARRLLRPGGEIYFADIYADRRVPEALRRDPVLYGECLAGALYWNDFVSLARAAGFADPRIVADRPIRIDDAHLARRVGDIRFYSVTCRLFCVDGLESAREDYGQAVRYRGTVEHCPERLEFDRSHHFPAGHRERVCGNTFRTLAGSRFAEHFDFFAGDGRHRGPFGVGDGGLPFAAAGPGGGSSCC